MIFGKMVQQITDMTSIMELLPLFVVAFTQMTGMKGGIYVDFRGVKFYLRVTFKQGV